MMPGNVLSTQVVATGFEEKIRRRAFPTIDYEMGGVAIGDGSKGLLVQQWTGLYKDGFLCAQPSDEEPIPVVAVSAEPDWLAVAFDQSMRPYFAYTIGADTFFYWFDSLIPGFTTTSFPGMLNPCLCLDEKRLPLIANSDVILAYVKDNNLCMRVQRERFANEIILVPGVNAVMDAVGMNQAKRLQFRLL